MCSEMVARMLLCYGDGGLKWCGWLLGHYYVFVKWLLEGSSLSNEN